MLEGNWTNTAGITVDNATMTIDGTWTNAGPVTLVNGGALSLDGAWTNAGATISATNASLNLGGMLSLTNMGTVSATGTTVTFESDLALGGTTYAFSGATGNSLVLDGCRLSNGTLALSGGAALGIANDAANALDNVLVQGDVSMSISGGRLRIAGDLDVTGSVLMDASSTSLAFEGSQAIAQGEVVFGAGGQNRFVEMDSPGTLTVMPGTAIRGGRGFIGSQFQFNNPIDVVNLGIVQCTGLRGTLMNQGVVRVGNSNAASTLTLTGSYTQTATGTLEVELGGTFTSQFDRLLNATSVQLGGALSITEINGFVPASGNQFLAIPSAGVTGSFSSVPAGYTTTVDGSGLTIQRL